MRGGRGRACRSAARQASGKRVPADRAEEGERLYRERDQGFTVKHFHQHLIKDHGFGWGYTWLKLHLQWAGARSAGAAADEGRGAGMPVETVQTNDAPSNAEVLIVGAGPAGLFAACELLRHGVEPRIIEQRGAPHHETRGTALQPAVLEMLHKAGVIEPFLAESVRIKEIELLGPGQTRLGLTELAGLGCKYEFQCSQPQWFTEAALRDHLASRGVQVEFGVEATSVGADGDGVTMSLDKGGRKEVVRAGYLIGADGGHSVSRHSMQEHLDGETYGGRFIVADVKLTFPTPPGRGRVVIGPKGFVLLSPLPEGRLLIFVNRDGADQRVEPSSMAELAALLNERIGTDVGLTDLRWTSYFQMHKRVAPFLSDGRRFLLGDAGHLSRACPQIEAGGIRESLKA